MSERIRILTVIRHPVGGIRTYLKYTYGHLDEQKYEFTILTVQGDEAQLILKDLEKFGVNLVEVEGRHPLAGMIWRMFLMIRGRRHWDLIHSQGYTAAMVAVLASVFSRTCHVVTPHEVLRQDQFAGWLGPLKRKILGFLLSRADVIQSVSHDAQENLVEYLPVLRRHPSKLAVIMNGISVEEFDQGSIEGGSTFRKDNGIGDEVVLFGFFGRFMPAKGFTVLIDAVEEIAKGNGIKRDFKVVAVNDGAFIREYKAIIARKGLSNYFLFSGFIPKVAPVMREMDAVVMPSLWEAFGLLATEGMIAGVPVIASNCIGLREAVKDTPAIMVEAGDSHSIAEGMRRFVSDEMRYKEEARRFIPIAKSRFDSRVSAAKLDNLFDEAINHRMKGTVPAGAG
ncbi:MAG: glycosyltransferase family 4 protein [Acidobacteriia bacterium]|nr:glycosyltransferase family 4 protein [Terriglobia bacterium]